jgi:hypothetical protein
MAIDEGSRHQLHVKLEQVLGSEEAGTLMAHLPPVGWGDVATKRDLDRLATDFRQMHEHMVTKLELQATKAEIIGALRHEFHSEIHSMMRWLIVFMSSLTLTLAGIAFAAARLT